MPPVIKPEACPDCGQGFQLPYAVRSQATMPALAKLVSAVGMAVTLVLLPVLLFPTILFVAEVKEKTRLRRKEEVGFLMTVSALPTIGIAILPAWLARRYARSRPRRLSTRCEACGWSGVCSVKETEELPPRQEVPLPSATEFEDAMQNKPKRLERRRPGKEDGAEQVNPDVDFKGME